MTEKRLLIAAVIAAGLAAACSPPQSANAAPAAQAKASATAAVTQDADTAKLWVIRLYDQYRSETFSPFGDPSAWFGPELVAALKEDEKLTPEGEMGLIDADPVCSCQDPTGMKAEVVEAVMTGPGRASVKVKLQWPLPADPIPEQIPDYTQQQTLHLALVNGQWRIRDIGGGAESESFLMYLQHGNGERRAGRPAR